MTTFPEEVLTRTKRGEIEVRSLIDRGPLVFGKRPFREAQDSACAQDRGNANRDVVDSVLPIQDDRARHDPWPGADESMDELHRRARGAERGPALCLDDPRADVAQPPSDFLLILRREARTPSAHLPATEDRHDPPAVLTPDRRGDPHRRHP